MLMQKWARIKIKVGGCKQGYNLYRAPQINDATFGLKGTF